MNLSLFSDRTLLGKLLRLPLRLLPQGLIIPILHGRLRGKKWIVGSGNHGCWLGIYEYGKQSIFTKLVKEGSVLFDIGAHVGYYTLLSSILTGPKGKVFAFEPLPDNIIYLKKHIQLNNITNVSIVEAAVSDCCGQAYFDHGPPSHLGRRSSYIGRLSPRGKLLVRTVSLDGLYSKGDITIPNYMKIDVEGNEILVLRGAISLITNYNPIIFLSTHGINVNKHCCDLLESINYQIEAIDGKSRGYSNELIAYKK